MREPRKLPDSVRSYASAKRLASGLARFNLDDMPHRVMQTPGGRFTAAIIVDPAGGESMARGIAAAHVGFFMSTADVVETLYV